MIILHSYFHNRKASRKISMGIDFHPSSIFQAILYWNYLARDKEKYIVSCGETWIYFNDFLKNVFAIENEEKKNLQTWFRQWKENFCKRVHDCLISFSYNGLLKIRKIRKGKSTQLTIKRELYAMHLYKKLPYFKPLTFKEWKFKLTNHISKSNIAFLKK